MIMHVSLSYSYTLLRRPVRVPFISSPCRIYFLKYIKYFRSSSLLAIHNDSGAMPMQQLLVCCLNGKTLTLKQALGDNINSAVVCFLERLSSPWRYIQKYTLKSVLCREFILCPKGPLSEVLL